MIDKDRRRALMLQCAQENSMRNTCLYSIVDGRILRHDAEIIGELEIYGGLHGIKAGHTTCECGWSPEDPTIKVLGIHPFV